MEMGTISSFQKLPLLCNSLVIDGSFDYIGIFIARTSAQELGPRPL